MNGTRILGVVCAGILATSLGTLVACGGSSDDKASSNVDPAVTAKTVQAASVMVEIADANGLKIGQATATVLAPRLVLTAAHMIAGQSKWVITTVDGKKVTGSKGLTYDWQQYDSDKAHPRRHDVGVIYLDSPIKLDAYPQVLAETSTMDATRIRGTGASFLPVASALAWNAQQPNSYVTDMPGAETLDTGGAVFNARGIVGIVEGKGLTTNKLYLARTDELATWINTKAGCAGASTATTFAVGAPKQQICDDAGNPIGNASSSSGGSSSGGSSSGSSSGASSSGSSGSSGSGTDSGPAACQTNDTDGIDSKTGTGTPSTGLNTSTGPNGSPKPTTGGAGNDGTSGASSSGSSNGASSGSSTSQGSSSGNTTTGGAGNSSGSTGSTTGTSSGSSGNNGSTNGASSGSSGAGNNGSTTGSGSNATPVPSTEPCQGPTDNPDTCPPEASPCVGASCGGSNAEPAGMDYGFCSCLDPKSNATYLK